ncbi:replication initiation protein [Persicobacter psychrovividus]|uniref:Initiator Rep protein WH1 domain-containing protein n=1 Tax=Persicobacter psychrovividus TaxID=387638 RepID=A0ABM7VNA1_9BACT|nr:hypothetical protein PEPS_47800 [Persicobacter psychrovividus]
MEITQKDVFQSHLLTHSRRKWELLDFKIVALLCIQLTVDTNLCHLNKSDLEAQLGVDLNGDRIKESAKRLMQEVEIRNTEEKWELANVFEKFTYDQGEISIKLTSFGKECFLDLKNYTAYNLDAILKFKSKHTAPIFQLIQTWKKVGQTRKMSLTDLRAYIDAEGVRYDRFNMLRILIDDAVAEINRISKLNLSYELFKTGRKFSHIQFKFNKYQQKEISPELQTAIDQQADNPHAYAQSLKNKQKTETVYTAPKSVKTKPSQGDFSNNELRHMEILKPMIDEGQSFEAVQAVARERYKFIFTEEMWTYLVG